MEVIIFTQFLYLQDSHGNTIQCHLYLQGLVWEEGDTLWVESKVLGDQDRW